MKTRNFFPNAVPLLGLAVLALSSAPAGVRSQESEEDSTSNEVRSILADPRLRNMLRSVKENPESVAKSIENDHDEAVRAATAILHEQMRKKEETGEEVPATRSAVTKDNLTDAKDRALNVLSKMMPEPETKDEVPAVRTNSTVAKPLATPNELPPTQGQPVPEPPSRTAVESLGNTGGNEGIATTKPVPKLPNTEETVPMIPDTPALKAGDVPPPQPLEPKYDKGRQAADSNGKSNMEVWSRESVLDNKSNELTFIGNVFVRHPEFTIRCDKLVIFMAGEGGNTGDGSGGSFKRAIATGGMVEIKRIDPTGKTQIAMARMADYNAITKDVILKGGPPYMQDGDASVRPSSNGAQILLLGNGQYKVVEESGQTHMVFPIEGGKAAENADGPLGGFKIPGQ